VTISLLSSSWLDHNWFFDPVLVVLHYRGRGPCLYGWHPSWNVFLCACIVHSVVWEDKMVGSGLSISQLRSLIQVALDMPSHCRKPAVATWSSPPSSLRRKTCCCPGLRGVTPHWIQLQNFYVPGTLSLNTQIHVTPNHLCIFTDTPSLSAVYLWSGQSCSVDAGYESLY